MKTVYWFMLTHVVNKGMVRRKWLPDAWVFRLAGIEYDYFCHYGEPLLEDRSSAPRQL